MHWRVIVFFFRTRSTGCILFLRLLTPKLTWKVGECTDYDAFLLLIWSSGQLIWFSLNFLVLSQRLGLGKGGVRMAPEDNLRQVLQVSCHLGYFRHNCLILNWYKWNEMKMHIAYFWFCDFVCKMSSNVLLACQVYPKTWQEWTINFVVNLKSFLFVIKTTILIKGICQSVVYHWRSTSLEI
jgi:hypothetical protein